MKVLSEQIYRLHLFYNDNDQHECMYVAPSLQDGLQWAPHLDIHTLAQLPSPVKSADLGKIPYKQWCVLSKTLWSLSLGKASCHVTKTLT